MKTLEEITKYMIEPGDEKKPWLVTAIISHCWRLARVYNVTHDKREVIDAVEKRLKSLEQGKYT